jgi:hypothetical protein
LCRRLQAAASKWTPGLFGPSCIAKAWTSKKACCQASKTGRNLQAGTLEGHQGQIDPKRLVFIDETWAKTNMGAAARLGFARKKAQRPQRQGALRPLEDMTFLAALRHDRIDAPWVVDGPINGELLRLYFEKLLVQTLKSGDIVILQLSARRGVRRAPLGSHKSQAVRTAIRAAGARLFFLPPYGPDLNPALATPLSFA